MVLDLHKRSGRISCDTEGQICIYFSTYKQLFTFDIVFRFHKCHLRYARGLKEMVDGKLFCNPGSISYNKQLWWGLVWHSSYVQLFISVKIWHDHKVERVDVTSMDCITPHNYKLIRLIFIIFNYLLPKNQFISVCLMSRCS